jgi:hypothetical protein
MVCSPLPMSLNWSMMGKLIFEPTQLTNCLPVLRRNWRIAICSALLSSRFSKLPACTARKCVLVHVYSPMPPHPATAIALLPLAHVPGLEHDAEANLTLLCDGLQGRSTASRTARGSPPRCSCATSTPTASTPSTTWHTPRHGEHSNATS